MRRVPLRAACLGQVAQCRRSAAGRLEEHARPIVRGDARQALPPLTTLARQEALERPARRRDAAGHEGRQHRRGARDRHHRAALRDPARHEVVTRIAHQRRAGIGHERHVLASREAAEQLPRAGGVTVSVEADERRADVVSRAEPPRQPRVLGRHDRHCRSTSSARSVTSARLPMGVATT